MLIRKFYSFFLLISFYFFVSGCAPSYAPQKWLPDTDQIQTEAYGGWLTIECKLKEQKITLLQGEYLTSDTANVYLLYDSLFVIPKLKIAKATLEIDDKNTNDYSAWSCLGMLSTISNGLMLIFTLPSWLITGVLATSGESYRDRYSEKNPTDAYWDEIKKFSRFPQGLPENIKLESLKRKEVYSK